MTERDDAKQTPRIRYLSRREMLSLVGSTAAGLALAGCTTSGSGQSGSGETTSASTAETTAETASTCVVRPEQTEGPYFVDTMLDRSDIREGREGTPLDLVFNVSRVDAGDAAACGPLAGALVDIWHCDALQRVALLLPHPHRGCTIVARKSSSWASVFAPMVVVVQLHCKPL